MSDQQQQQDFLFDDFFASDEDKGITIPVKIKGRVVPITIRRGLSLAERSACEIAAVKKHIGPNGKVVYDGIDESVLLEEVLVRSILRWPFTFKNGEMVPLTRENVRKLLGGAEDIAKAIKTIEDEGEDALVPFAPASAAA